MQTPLKITFRHMSSSGALETCVRERADHLERLHDRIISCDVVIGAPAGRHQHGAPFDVRINITVPDGDLHVHNGHSSAATNVDVYVAVRDAFDALERKIRRHVDGRHRPREHASIRKDPPPVGEEQP